MSSQKIIVVATYIRDEQKLAIEFHEICGCHRCVDSSVSENYPAITYAYPRFFTQKIVHRWGRVNSSVKAIKLNGLGLFHILILFLSVSKNKYIYNRKKSLIIDVLAYHRWYHRWFVFTVSEDCQYRFPRLYGLWTFYRDKAHTILFSSFYYPCHVCLRDKARDYVKERS